jgi:hypothetical protein
MAGVGVVYSGALMLSIHGEEGAKALTHARTT